MSKTSRSRRRSRGLFSGSASRGTSGGGPCGSVFYDQTANSDTPIPWPSIERALGLSRYLILLASKEAAASPAVDREISWWLEHKGANTLLIALTDGDLARDDEIGDFVWRMPLPPALSGGVQGEPKWLDLRAYRGGADPGNSRFIEAAAELAAAIHERPKVDLLSQEVRQQRHGLLTAWAAAGAFALLTVIAGWQWWGAGRATQTERERAAAAERTVAQLREEVAARRSDVGSKSDKAASQRDRVERNFGSAKDAVERAVVRIAQDLRKAKDMPVEEAARMLAVAQSMMDELVSAVPNDLALQRSRAIMFLEFAETYVVAGDLARARSAADQSAVIRRKLVAADPGNAGWQRELSVVLIRVGEVRLAANDNSGALAAYEESLALRRKLARPDPGNAARQRDLSVVLNRVGDARLATGDQPGALATFEESLAVMRKLAAVDLVHAGWQRDVSAILDRVGDVRLTSGDRPGALAAYEESLAIARKLATTDPDSARWQGDLVVSLHKVSTASDPLRARSALHEALAILEALAQDNRLTAAQQAWPQFMRDALARLPETAGRR